MATASPAGNRRERGRQRAALDIARLESRQRPSHDATVRPQLRCHGISPFLLRVHENPSGSPIARCTASHNQARPSRSGTSHVSKGTEKQSTTRATCPYAQSRAMRSSRWRTPARLQHCTVPAAITAVARARMRATRCCRPRPPEAPRRIDDHNGWVPSRKRPGRLLERPDRRAEPCRGGRVVSAGVTSWRGFVSDPRGSRARRGCGGVHLQWLLDFYR